MPCTGKEIANLINEGLCTNDLSGLNAFSGGLILRFCDSSTATSSFYLKSKFNKKNALFLYVSHKKGFWTPVLDRPCSTTIKVIFFHKYT